MKRNEILEAAKRCVCGDRERDYGTPEKNFELIAELWTTYLKAKCVSPEADVCINGEDVATLMCLFKIARMTQRLGPCPQNCPDRYANEHETCHSTCQRYMRYKLIKLLEGKQRAKAIDEVGFWRDVGKNLRKKSERKAK